MLLPLLLILIPVPPILQAEYLSMSEPDDTWPQLMSDIRGIIFCTPGGEDAVRDWERNLRIIVARARLPALKADVARLTQQLEAFRAMLRVALEVPYKTMRAVEYFERWTRRTLEALEAAAALRDEAELALVETAPDDGASAEGPPTSEISHWTRSLMDAANDW